MVWGLGPRRPSRRLGLARPAANAQRGLSEKTFNLKVFWQRSLLHSMFFTSNMKKFVQ